MTKQPVAFRNFAKVPKNKGGDKRSASTGYGTIISTSSSSLLARAEQFLSELCGFGYSARHKPFTAVAHSNRFNVHGFVHRKNIPIYIQQDATLHSLLYLENCSTCFG